MGGSSSSIANSVGLQDCDGTMYNPNVQSCCNSDCANNLGILSVYGRKAICENVGGGCKSYSSSSYYSSSSSSSSSYNYTPPSCTPNWTTTQSAWGCNQCQITSSDGCGNTSTSYNSCNDNSQCPPCQYNTWNDYGGCNASCGYGKKSQYSDGYNYGKNDCYRQWREVDCDSGVKCCDPNKWGGWAAWDSSEVVGCKQRRYYGHRANECGGTQQGTRYNGGWYDDNNDPNTDQCPSCWVTRDWYDTTNCPLSGSCGGTKHQRRDVTDPYNKGGCPSQDRDVDCPTNHINAWSGWDNDNGQSRIIGCRKRRYYRYRTDRCDHREDGNDGNGGYQDRDDGDNSQCPSCYVSRDWYDTTTCIKTGSCGGQKHQHRDVSDPYGRNDCPGQDQDVACPTDHVNAWSGWDNDNGQSRIIGCRKRRYYRYRTTPCDDRQDGNDGNGGYQDRDDGDISQCPACAFTFNQSSCPSTPCGQTVTAQGSWSMVNNGSCNTSVSAPGSNPTCTTTPCCTTNDYVFTQTGSCPTACGTAISNQTGSWSKKTTSTCIDGASAPTTIPTCPATPACCTTNDYVFTQTGSCPTACGTAITNQTGSWSKKTGVTCSQGVSAPTTIPTCPATPACPTCTSSDYTFTASAACPTACGNASIYQPGSWNKNANSLCVGGAAPTAPPTCPATPACPTCTSSDYTFTAGAACPTACGTASIYQPGSWSKNANSTCVGGAAAPTASPTCPATPACCTARDYVFTASVACPTACGTASIYQPGSWSKNANSTCVGGAAAPTAPPTCPATPVCPPCNYSIWSPSGLASTTGCKTGIQTITRTATNNGANDCTEPTTSTVPVGVTDTSKCAPCGYTQWSPSGLASTTGCKTGIQTLNRTSTDNGKGDCTAPTTSYVPVGTPDASQCAPCGYTPWTPSGPVTTTGCKTGIQSLGRTSTDNGKRDCTAPTTSYVPVGSPDTSLCAPCDYSPWSPSGPTTTTGCKTGIQTLGRTSTDNGKGDCTAPTTSYVPSGTTDTSLCAPCGYTPWANNSPMSITGCLIGSQTQSRTATDNGKDDCALPLLQTVPVATPNSSLCPCTYDTNWSYSPCSTPCGGGMQTGQTNLTPGSGDDCPATIYSPQACNTTKCPPCSYGSIDTSTLSPCSARCGTGTQNGNLLLIDSNYNTSCPVVSSRIPCNAPAPCFAPITVPAMVSSPVTSIGVNIYLLRDKNPFIVQPNQTLSCATSSGACPMQLANNVAFSFTINTSVPNATVTTQQILSIILSSTNQTVFSVGICANSNNLYVQRASATNQNNYVSNCKIPIDIGIDNTFYVICNGHTGSYQIYKNGTLTDTQYSQDGALFTSGILTIKTGNSSIMNGSLSNIALLTSNMITLQDNDMDATIAYMNK